MVGYTKMRAGKRETLKAFTERAIDASFKGQLIPPLVYVPHQLRGKAARVALDGSVTVNPTDAAEDAARIHRSDPTGFLIAVMQGQPIPEFTITRDKQGAIEVALGFVAPLLPERLRAAEHLARVQGRVKKGDPGYDAMIARAAAEGDE